MSHESTEKLGLQSEPTNENEPSSLPTNTIKQHNARKELVYAKLVCQGCQRTVTLKKALTEKWKTCSICGAFLCKTCETDYEIYSENVCPGSKTTEHHQMELIAIPEQLLKEYVIHAPPDITLDPVYQAFFKDFQKQADPFNEIIEFFQEPIRYHNKFEELWAHQKNVLIQKTKEKVIRY